MNPKIMTLDFVTGQLRLALVAILAYGGGRGWFTPADATFITAIAGALGPLLLPWAWSIYANAGKINVASGSAAAAVAQVEKSDPSSASTGAASAIQAAKVAAVLLAVVLAGLLAMPGDANAQARKPLSLNLPVDPLHLNGTPVTGDTSKDMQALWQKIVSSSLTDLNYAAAMAANANTTTSTVRLQCLKAIIQLNEQASGANLKNPDGTPMAKPDPHLFTDVESLAEIVDNLSPQGPLFVSCAGAAQLAKTNVLSFVNAVVTGAAGLAAMPIIPGL